MGDATKHSVRHQELRVRFQFGALSGEWAAHWLFCASTSHMSCKREDDWATLLLQ